MGYVRDKATHSDESSGWLLAFSPWLLASRRRVPHGWIAKG